MKCTDVGFGTCVCSYNILLPYYVRFCGDTPIEPEPKRVCIDKCLLREVLDLWEKGIKTTGNCCGHGRQGWAFISVPSKFAETMKSMGYESYADPDGKVCKNHFIPKTELRYGEADKGFNWWDENEWI